MQKTLMQKHSAFSLVELSIVLVILGLLTGGILAGQSLIKAAELRSVSTEYDRYTAALYSFRDRYFALPGDMPNATKFWGAGTCPGLSADTPTPQPNTCDGNGNGFIDFDEGNSNGTYRAWQQLALAGLIEGSYTGVVNGTPYNENLTSFTTPNVPKSKFSNAGWAIKTLGPVMISNSRLIEGEYGTVFDVNGISSIGQLLQAVFTPEEVWNIDTKLDDGRAGMGKVLTWEPGGPGATTCVDLAASITLPRTGVSYMLNNVGPYCRLIMKTGI